MGIKGLYKFIQKYAPSAIKELTIDDLKNKTIVFDTSILLYQFVIAIRNTGVDLTNNDGKITSHIHAIIMKTISFLKKKINPIFVFDGKPPDIKMDTLKERSKNRKNANLELENNIEMDEETRIKLLKQTVVITSKQIDECKEVLNLIGIPTIDASQEADSQCALLSKLNLVDAVASEDMDLLTFGVKKLLRNVNSNKIIEIQLSKILKETSLTYDQFIDLCIMLGCDYSPTIEGIGMHKAYYLIKKHGSLDTIVNTPNILLGKKILNISDEFKNKYKSAQDYFKDPPVNNEFGELKWNKPNFEGLSKLLIEKYSYSKYSVNKLLINQLSGGHYKKIAGKNSKELYINNEFSTSMNILNINIPNNCDIDDQFIDDIDTVSDSSAVNEILNIINKNNIKHLLNVAPTI
jgi:flap endonuclease-1